MCREFIVVDTNYIVIGDLRFVDGSLLINVTMFISFSGYTYLTKKVVGCGVC
jgi:hypothetical protein